MKEQKPKVLHDQLVKAVAASSDYHEYEIKDVLLHLAYNIQQFILEGNQVSVRGLGIFYEKKAKPRVFKSGITGEVHEVDTAPSAGYKPDVFMKNALADARAERRQNQLNKIED